MNATPSAKNRTSPMLLQRKSDARAWTTATLDPSSCWYYRLPDDLLAALEASLHQLRGHPRHVTTLEVRDFPCASFADRLRPACAALENGRGFVILDGLQRE